MSPKLFCTVLIELFEIGRTHMKYTYYRFLKVSSCESMFI